MGYILELRKQVGHRPLIMTCAGVLLLNEKKGVASAENVQTTGYGDIPGVLWNSGRASKTVPDGKYRRKQD